MLLARLQAPRAHRPIAVGAAHSPSPIADCGIFCLHICGPSKGEPMPYERPRATQAIVSDTWPTRQYEAPAVVAREKIAGLLAASTSDDPKLDVN